MGEERVLRRLAAILAADVVGDSRLMREDETDILAQLETLRSVIRTFSRRHCDRAICGSPSGEGQVGTGSPMGSWQ